MSGCPASECARLICDSAHIQYLHSGTEPGPHGFGFLCCCTYDPVCSSPRSMPYDKYMISVTGTICDMVEYKKIDF